MRAHPVIRYSVLALIGGMWAGGVGSFPRARLSGGESPHAPPRVASPQIAYHGKRLSFVVPPPPAGVWSMAVEKKPRGEITFDTRSGVFAYTPAPTDKEDFDVRFSEKGRDGGTPLTVRITPVPWTAPEYDLVQSERPTPGVEQYVVVTESENQQETFNGQSRRTRSVHVSGVEVVFDPGDTGQLHRRFHDAADVKELFIYAQTVIIRGPLRLPQTDVTIYARELRFEDKDKGKPAVLDTTPLSVEQVPGQSQNGQHGHKAGSLRLFIKHFASEGTGKQFILRGGNGQTAGPGKAGAAGASMAVLTGRRVDIPGGWMQSKVPNVVYIEYRGKGVAGEKKWPGDGENAIPAGKPGNGGAGGDVTTGLPSVRQFVDNGGGVAGKQGARMSGGAAGQPTEAAWHIRPTGRFDDIDQIPKHTSKPGKDADAPKTDIETGSPGTFSVTDAAKRWVHPFAVQAVIAYARDVYLSGRNDAARAVLEDTLSEVAGYKGDSPEQDLAIEQIRQEMLTLLHGIAHNLDYFGNPAGWVPALSFETHFKAFEKEIDSGVRILYLTRWAQKRWGDREKKAAALGLAVGKLREEIEAETEALNNAQALVPELEVRSQNLATQTELYKQKLKVREQELLTKAEENIRGPWWKQSLGTLAALAQVFPVPQPLAGGIGKLAGLVTNFDPDNPLASLDAAADLAAEFRKSGYAEANRQTAAKLKSMKPADAKDPRKYAEELLRVGKEAARLTAMAKDVVHARQAPRGEVEAELARLKAQDPEFQDLVAELERLLAQKEVFAAELAKAVQQIQGSGLRITQVYLEMDSINQQRGSLLGGIDHAARLAVQGMERRVKERLVHYQYLLAKSYEYRLLKPYPGNFQLKRLFDKLAELTEADGATPGLEGSTDGRSRFLSLKGIYVDELRELVSDIIRELNGRPPRLTVPKKRLNVSPALLDILNRDRTVALRLADAGIITPSDVDSRLVEVRVSPEDLRVTAHKQVGEQWEPMSKDEVDRIDAKVTLFFEHSGLSPIRWAGKNYLFEHRSRSGLRPVYWRYDHNVPRKEGVHAERSQADESLIRTLVEKPDDRRMLYFQPSAMGDIVVRLETAAPPGVRLVVENLGLQVTYDGYTAEHRVLEVASKGADSPYIRVTASDLSGRSDGRGRFTRFYPAGQTVQLTAPASIGRLKFQSWQDGDGSTLSQQPRVSVTMTGNKRVQAVYTEPAGR